MAKTIFLRSILVLSMLMLLAAAMLTNTQPTTAAPPDWCNLCRICERGCSNALSTCLAGAQSSQEVEECEANYVACSESCIPYCNACGGGNASNNSK